MPRQPALPIFSRRLREARAAKGISQKELGVLAGLDRFVASTRINRYEQGVHVPDPRTAARLAKVLGVPLPYLFADNERLARLIKAFAPLSDIEQEALLKELEGRKIP